ncbi:hypothetical protein [Nannocystis punicea]|uniref:Uncharacterized protein n=1 Tax=Nannocystis punicea TaxID=2995304 RepID=A0ABY7HFK2_9BACT|nr:hypothetical protein [Nannocystis poenicansa]WAS98069.1 hypothetical protein O0S08_18170 [Nannocystis poenicansa]
MRVLHAIRTPWAPYSVMFSNDGTRLAAGGGAWYGNGGVALARLSTGEIAVTPMSPQRQPGYPTDPPTVAGLYFSADDRHLVAATRGSSLSPGPTILFGVTDLAIAREAAFVPRHEPRRSRGCATGVMLTGELALVRHHTSSLDELVAVRQFSERLECRGDDTRHPLTHCGMVVRRGWVFTGGGGSLGLAVWRPETGVREAGKAADGLVAVPLASDEPIQRVHVRGGRRVTAIAALPGEDGFLTGGLDGELDRWSFAETLQQERLPTPEGPPGSIEPELPTTPEVRQSVAGLAWATYSRDSVVGIVTLCDGERWVSVDAGGRLRLWRGTTLLGAWTLPAPGTPRSLAAHPTEPCVAVGIKQGGFGRPSSLVLVLEC